MATFSNPIGKGLSPERIDMGVDYGGSGPLYALGSGTIANLYNSGWPGGNFLTIHLDSGQYIYYAEDIAPLVSVGQRVTAGQHIANATGGSSGIEVGWAAPPGSGNAMAAVSGQAATSGDPGSHSTAYGVLMSNLIKSLGGPAGVLQSGGVVGTVPSSFGITTTGVTDTAQQGSSPSSALTGGGGGIISDIENILGLGAAQSFATDLNSFFTKIMWILEPSSWLRIGSFVIAMVLLLAALIVFTKADQKVNIAPVPVPV